MTAAAVPTPEDRAEIEKALAQTLKRFDKIGFGRRGVLDAEQSIVEWDRKLKGGQRAALRAIVLSLVEADGAKTAAKELTYNTPEMVQALAITLCGTMPVRESLKRLQSLAQEGAFKTEDEAPCADALRGALGLLEYSG